MLAELVGFRIRSDVERKRLAGLGPEADTGSAVGAGLYSPELTDRTYARLLELARSVLGAGFPALLDATFLDAGRREAARSLAGGLGAPFVILSLEVPQATIRSRLRQRAREEERVSEGDEAVLEHQLRTQDPLGPEEVPLAVRVESPAEADFPALARRLRETARIPPA